MDGHKLGRKVEGIDNAGPTGVSMPWLCTSEGRLQRTSTPMSKS